MVDCAADTYWPCNDAGKAHNGRMRDGYLPPDMVNMHIIAKARLQEKGQCYFNQSVNLCDAKIL